MPGITTWPVMSITLSAVPGSSEVWPTDSITPFLANRPPFLISALIVSFFCWIVLALFVALVSLVDSASDLGFFTLFRMITPSG